MSPSEPPLDEHWPRGTRWLHFGLAGAVSLALVVSLAMGDPASPEGSLGLRLFHLHTYVGLIALAFMVLHWLWIWWGPDREALRHLFPWSGFAFGTVRRETRELLRFKIPRGGANGGLSGFVHGLGLLAATGMVATGGAMFVFLHGYGLTQASFGIIKAIHVALGNVMWAYLVGHASLALLHHVLRHRPLSVIFRL